MTVKYSRTRKVPLTDLTPYPGNAKLHNDDELRASIRRHGQYRALVVRELDGGGLVVLAGNGTLAALAAEGHTQARCEIVTCDDLEASRINLADNRIADLGDYDEVSLVAQLQELAGDLDGIGYTETDLSELLRATDAYANEATGFLSDHVDPDNPAGRHAARHDRHAASDAENEAIGGFVQMSWTCTKEQRDVVRAACKTAQVQWDLHTSTEALIAIAQHYLDEGSEGGRSAA